LVLWSFGLFQTSIGLFLLGLSSPLFAQTWAPHFSTSATWHDNATNADRDSDILSALQWDTEISSTRRLTLTGADGLRFGGRMAFELWPRYDGLDRAAVGGHLGWTHKFGLGPFAPALSLDVAGDMRLARESGRAGRAGSATLGLHRRFNESWRLSLAHECARYDARKHAFDRTGGETSLRIDYDFDERWRLSATARHRQGGVLAYATPPRPDLLQKGKALTTVTTFDRQEPMVAYYFLAQTLSGAAAVSRALDRVSSLNLVYEHRQTKKGALRYRNQLVSLSLARQF